MKIYHNPRCSKSRETLAIIKDNGVEVEVVEYLKEVPSKKELTELLHLLGKRPIEIIRKGEADFKTHFKGKELSDEEWIEAMLAFPKLIERPIVVSGNKAVLGRPPQNVSGLLA